jgi:hypothetical protein
MRREGGNGDLCLPTTLTYIHPPLRLLDHLFDHLIQQFCRTPLMPVFPYYLIPRLKAQLIYIQLDCARLDSLPHHRWWKIIGTVQRDNHAAVDLFVYRFQAVEMQLARFGACGTVVAMYVADRGGEDIDISSQKIINIFLRCKQGCLISISFLTSSEDICRGN